MPEPAAAHVIERHFDDDFRAEPETTVIPRRPCASGWHPPGATPVNPGGSTIPSRRCAARRRSSALMLPDEADVIELVTVVQAEQQRRDRAFLRAAEAADATVCRVLPFDLDDRIATAKIVGEDQGAWRSPPSSRPTSPASHARATARSWVAGVSARRAGFRKAAIRPNASSARRRSENGRS